MDPFLYNYYYVNAMMAVTLLTGIVYSFGPQRMSTQEGGNVIGIWALPLAVTVFLGTRPVSGAFVDMTTYADAFNMAKDRGFASFKSDWVFSSITMFFADNFSLEYYFLGCSALYVVPLAIAASRHHGRWGFALFLAFAGAFSFFGYGVNGIRGGIAASFGILAFAYSDKKMAFAIFSLLAIGTHKAMAIPMAAFALTYVLAIPWVYVAFWATCLAANLLAGEALSTLIGSALPSSDLDSRAEIYFGGTGADKGGFRLDFILYSIVPVVISHFYADPKARHGLFYRKILCAYLATNAFWLLSMYAAFSNRFAYLSWFLLPWVILAPHLPSKEDADRGKGYPSRPTLIAGGLLAHFAFTYVMFIFVYR